MDENIQLLVKYARQKNLPTHSFNKDVRDSCDTYARKKADKINDALDKQFKFLLSQGYSNRQLLELIDLYAEQ